MKESNGVSRRSWARNFFSPRLTGWFWLRLGVVTAVAYLVFGFWLLPCIVSGSSMEPTYGSLGLNFCRRESNAGGRVQNGDVVIIRYAPKVFYLKRVVGESGDTIEFIGGKLHRNGKAVFEPYLKLPSDWNTPAYKVAQDELFVVGDNRSMPIDQHKFGVVKKNRIIGEPLW